MAADGADVIACSLGPNGADWDLTSVLDLAIRFVARQGRGGRGVPIFWAASNGHFEAAIGHLRALIATGEAPVDHPVLAYDTAIFGLWPQQLLGESLFELGRFDEAAAAFRAAREAGAPAREVMTKLSVCESLARRKTVSADGTRTSSGNKALGDE